MDPHLIHDSFGKFEPVIQMASRLVTAECPYTLQWDAPSLLKITPSHGDLHPQSNTWFPGPSQVLNPNGNSISLAVFCRAH